MPVSSKAKISELRVGIMAAFALALLGFLVFLLAGSNSLFKSTSDIFTYFDDSAAVAVAAPVTLNGITVGKVTKVDLSGSNQPGKIIRVKMQVEDQYLGAIPTDSQCFITAGNLLGTKYINIKKGHGSQKVAKGGELPSQNMTTIDDFVQQGKGTIGMLLEDPTIANKALSAISEMDRLVKTLNAAANSDTNTLGKLINDKSALYDDLHQSVLKINTLMEGLDKGEGTAGKLLKDPKLYDDAVKTIADLRKILADIESGQGDIGKLLKSNELHDELKGTISRVDAMLDKINKGEGTLGQ